MTVVETMTEAQEQATMAAAPYAFAREELRVALLNRALPTEGYEALMAEYLNHFHDMHFVDGHAVFESFDDAAAVAKTDAELVVGRAIGSLPEAKKRLLGYWEDETSQVLEAQNLPRLPRAMTLLLIDMIDENKRWRY
ncbi:MAG TPA: hypothetical protein VLF87_00090 [Patescibacteria group bacterium]|nr:hypothetical protein [Patescibacteria group bacterium]